MWHVAMEVDAATHLLLGSAVAEQPVLLLVHTERLDFKAVQVCGAHRARVRCGQPGQQEERKQRRAAYSASIHSFNECLTASRPARGPEPAGPAATSAG